MRGVVYLGDSEVEVRDFNRPEPGPGQVVIEMRVAGLCGSDLHKYHSSREWARERNGMISGHEPAGVVADVGKDVENVSEGDRGLCLSHGRVRSLRGLCLWNAGILFEPGRVRQDS